MPDNEVSVRRDEYGLAIALEVRGVTVLQLEQGSRRNAACIGFVAQAIEDWHAGRRDLMRNAAIKEGEKP